MSLIRRPNYKEYNSGHEYTQALEKYADDLEEQLESAKKMLCINP